VRLQRALVGSLGPEILAKADSEGAEVYFKTMELRPVLGKQTRHRARYLRSISQLSACVRSTGEPDARPRGLTTPGTGDSPEGTWKVELSRALGPG
jgi:hypothetical protein